MPKTLFNISQACKRLSLPWFFITMLGLFPAKAQELNCNVILETEQVQTTEQRIFDDLKKAITNFMNTRNWTDDDFSNEERISCNLVITITKMPSINSFQANAQIQSARPVFNSDYQSTTLNHVDKQWNFNYNQGQPLEFNQNNVSSNLTAMLAFYAYVIIGIDYDTFGELGGSPYFNTAQQIVNNAQNLGAPGWKSFGGNDNRHQISDNLNSEQLKPWRKSLYVYHRQGLDKFMEDPKAGRQKIYEALQLVQKAYNIKPSAAIFRTYFNTKAREIADIFSEGSRDLRNKVYKLLMNIDPTHSNEYEKIRAR